VAAASGKQVAVWDLNTAQLVATLRGYREPGGFHVGTVNLVRFIPNSHYLAVGVSDQSEYGSTRIYDLKQPDRIHQLIEGHLGCTIGLTFSPSGKTMATYGCDGMVYVLDRDPVHQRWKKRCGLKFSWIGENKTPIDDNHRVSFNYQCFQLPVDDDWLMDASKHHTIMISTKYQ